MKTFLFAKEKTQFGPVKTTGVPVMPLPFVIGNSDRILFKLKDGNLAPYVGLRSNVMFVDEELTMHSFIKFESRIENELPMVQKALNQINAADSHQQDTRTGSGVRVFLFDLVPQNFQLQNVDENRFKQFDGIDYFAPFKIAPYTKFVAEISHLPFVPGTNDIICPFTKADDDPRLQEKKPAHYCGAMRWYDPREKIVLVFAYKLPVNDKRIQQPIDTNDTHKVLMNVVSREKFTLKMVVSPEATDITYLDFVPGRYDLFKLDNTDTVYSGEYRTYDAHTPNLTRVLVRNVRAEEIEVTLK